MEKIRTSSLIFALIGFILTVILYEKGKKTYKEYISPLDKKEFGLKEFLPIGFQLMEMTKYQYNSQLDRRMRKWLKELYNPDYSEFYLHVYWAATATYVVFGFMLTAILHIGLGGDPVSILIGLGLCGIMIYVNFSEVKNRVTKRHLKVSMDFPDLTNKIIILSGAGLTIRASLFKIVQEMRGDSLLYEELEHVIALITNGSTVEAAMDWLNIRCNMPEMRRFVAIILQNIQRGGQDVLFVLQDIGKEQWDNRKAAAKRMAEEAGTQMLFPMMLMLLAVIILTVAPAVMSMNI